MSQTYVSPTAALQVFERDVLVQGRPARIECVEVCGQTYSISNGPLRVVRLEDEWYEDVREVEEVIRSLAGNVNARADLLTFWQRPPQIQAQYRFHTEWESIAVLPVQSFDYWWNKQVARSARNKVRKSQKAGVEVRVCAYDDAFVEGMTRIFNETPIRQGRRFWHYGKDFATVKEQFSRYLFRENVIGAYLGDELLGFVMVADAGNFAAINQIISKVQHRDKAISNALLAKTVELCASKRLPYLVYALWEATSLADFKRQSGFEEMRLPRYYVPLSAKGRAALKLGLHRGWKTLLPGGIADRLRSLRRFYYERRSEKEAAG